MDKQKKKIKPPCSKKNNFIKNGIVDKNNDISILLRLSIFFDIISYLEYKNPIKICKHYKQKKFLLQE